MRLVPTRRRLFSGILTLAMVGGLLVLSAAPAWAISVSPTTIDFGKIREGNNSQTVDLTISISSGYKFSDFYGSFSGALFGYSYFGTCFPAFVGPGTCDLHLTLLWEYSSPGPSPSLGVASGTFVASEVPTGGGAASTSNLSITAEGVANAAPQCNNVSASVTAGLAGSFNLSCTDTDPITYAVVSPPQHGTATLTPATGAVNYVPNAGYTGPDSFTYQADDGIYPASNVATASITVRPKADHPSPSPSPTPTPTFELNLSKAAGGRVTSDPAGINCPNDCTGDFAEGTQVTLTAKARAGWEFKRWRYRCKGQGEVCMIDVTSNFRAMAVFVRPPIVRGDRNRGL